MRASSAGQGGRMWRRCALAPALALLAADPLAAQAIPAAGEPADIQAVPTIPAGQRIGDRLNRRLNPTAHPLATRLNPPISRPRGSSGPSNLWLEIFRGAPEH